MSIKRAILFPYSIDIFIQAEGRGMDGEIKNS